MAQRDNLAATPAEVRVGTQRDAILYPCGANTQHGLRRSQADKRKAVGIMLADPEWSKWSDREIARRCGVSHPFVGKLRHLPAPPAPPAPAAPAAPSGTSVSAPQPPKAPAGGIPAEQPPPAGDAPAGGGAPALHAHTRA